MAPKVSVIPQPPRRGQPPPHHHARVRAAARPATPARDLAPAEGVVLPSSAGGSSSPPVLAPCKGSLSGNVARARSKANTVRSEQATCAVTNHVRRTAGIFGPCSVAQRCAARSAPPRCAYAAPFNVRCDARRSARAAPQQGPQQGPVRSQLSREWQLSFRSGARCCGPLRSAQCTTATRICRARLRAARQAAQRAPGAAALCSSPEGGLRTGGLRRWSPPHLRVHKAHTDARTKFDGERRRARRVPGVPGENPSPLETVSVCVRP